MFQSLRTFSFKAPKTLAVAVVSLVVLSGCAGAGASSDGSSAAASPTTSESATPTPTPSPTPSAVYKPASAEGPAENVPLPKMPAAAKKETKAGLEAFAKYWFDVLYYSYQTGDTKTLEAVSGPNCKICNVTLAAATDGNDEGHWIVGGDIEIYGTQPEFVKTPAGNYQILIHLRQSKFDVYSENGKIIQTVDDERDGIQIMEASINGGAWVANTLEVMAR